MATRNVDVAVIGHFSIDHIRLPWADRPYVILGGAVAYVSFAARRLDAKTLIISKVGSDFPCAYLWWLEKEGTDISYIVKVNELTTSFELIYNKDLSSRSLKLRSRGSSLSLNEVSHSFYAEAIHIAPIAAEIPYDVIEQLRKKCKHLSIDPQGMTRFFSENGKVSKQGKMDKRFLSGIDI
jgi:sugar/nucleoside kinase (ribokinase family)